MSECAARVLFTKIDLQTKLAMMNPKKILLRFDVENRSVSPQSGQKRDSDSDFGILDRVVKKKKTRNSFSVLVRFSTFFFTSFV